MAETWELANGAILIIPSDICTATVSRFPVANGGSVSQTVGLAQTFIACMAECCSAVESAHRSALVADEMKGYERGRHEV